jgi:FkbM family methyltransferase
MHHLRHNYFHEFGHSIPLGYDFWAHLLEHDAYDSFSEIFIQQEYANYLPNEPISRILDIGAHYGYFSLWIQSKYPDREIHSLMIEPSPKCIRSLEKLVNQPQFKGRFVFLQKAINAFDVQTTKFYDRSHMGGSMFANSKNETSVEIQTLREDDAHKVSPPPYDLIKCDIEGSEWEFINHYPKLLKATQHLLLEWHSWHQGGGGFAQLSEKLTNIHFEIIRSSLPVKAVGNEGEVGLLLAKNLNFQG